MSGLKLKGKLYHKHSEHDEHIILDEGKLIIIIPNYWRLQFGHHLSSNSELLFFQLEDMEYHQTQYAELALDEQTWFLGFAQKEKYVYLKIHCETESVVFEYNMISKELKKGLKEFEQTLRQLREDFKNKRELTQIDQQQQILEKLPRLSPRMQNLYILLQKEVEVVRQEWRCDSTVHYLLDDVDMRKQSRKGILIHGKHIQIRSKQKILRTIRKVKIPYVKVARYIYQFADYFFLFENTMIDLAIGQKQQVFVEFNIMIIKDLIFGFRMKKFGFTNEDPRQIQFILLMMMKPSIGHRIDTIIYMNQIIQKLLRIVLEHIQPRYIDSLL